VIYGVFRNPCGCCKDTGNSYFFGGDADLTLSAMQKFPRPNFPTVSDGGMDTLRSFGANLDSVKMPPKFKEGGGESWGNDTLARHLTKLASGGTAAYNLNDHFNNGKESPRSTDSRDFEDLILALKSGSSQPLPLPDQVYQSKDGTPYTVRRISIADTHL